MKKTIKQENNTSSKYNDFLMLDYQINEPFAFQQPTFEQLELLNSNPPVVISEIFLKESSLDRQQILPRMQFTAQIQENLLFIQRELKPSENLRVLNFEFARFKVITDDDNQKFGFSLERKGLVQQFYLSNNVSNREIYKIWMTALNKYVIRVGSLQQYKIIKKLGEGAQAKVYKIFKGKNGCTCNQEEPCKITHKYFAVKIFQVSQLKGKTDIKQLVQEIRVMRELQDCSNSLTLAKIYANSEFINLFLEFQEGGTLTSNIIKSNRSQKIFSDTDAQTICAQLLLTVDYMQSRNIIHRDLKPDNILLNSNEEGKFDIRIADYGLSIKNQPSYLDDKLSQRICGTPGYIAPEALQHQKYSSNSDVFSVGVILFTILTGESLFRGRKVNEVLKLNRDCDTSYVKNRSKCANEDAQDLLLALLSADPEQRPSAYEALQHKWFNSIQEPIQESLLANNPKRISDNKSFINYINCNPYSNLHEDKHLFQIMFGQGSTSQFRTQQHHVPLNKIKQSQQSCGSFSQDRSVKNYYNAIDEFRKKSQKSAQSADNFESFCNIRIMNHSIKRQQEILNVNDSLQVLQNFQRVKSKFAKDKISPIERKLVRKLKSSSLQIIMAEESKHIDVQSSYKQQEDINQFQNEQLFNNDYPSLDIDVSEETHADMKQNNHTHPQMGALNIVHTHRRFL